MNEIFNFPQADRYNPQNAFDDLVSSIAKQIAEKTLEAIEERDSSIWLSQKELIKQKGFSHSYIKRMEKYGLQSRKEGKEKKYCLADINEVLHSMKG